MTYTGSVHTDGIKPTSFINGNGAELSAPYLAVKLKASADNTVEVAGAADALLFIGVTQQTNPIKSLEPVAVKQSGNTLATAGGDVTIGALLKLASGGKFVATTTPGDLVVARSLSNGANTNYIEIELLKTPYLIPTP